MARIVEPRLVDDPTVKETADELCTFMDHVQQKNLAVDFSTVDRISSAMLGRLLTLQFSIESKGGYLGLRKVGSGVRRMMAANMLDHMFRIEESRTNIPPVPLEIEAAVMDRHEGTYFRT